jgi:hypothetical protein
MERAMIAAAVLPDRSARRRYDDDRRQGYRLVFESVLRILAQVG